MTSLHCLGTGGYHPNERRHTSCYVVPEWGLMLDAGTATFRAAPFLRPDRLDIVLSHAHLDHTFGLTVLLDLLYRQPVDQVYLWAADTKLDAVRSCLFNEHLFPVPLKIHYCELPSTGRLELPNCELTWRDQEHPGGSLAYKVVGDDGEMVLATDTYGDLTSSFAEWCDGTSLLVHECYFKDDQKELAKKTGHTYTSRMIEVLQSVRPERVVLTHLNPLDTSDDPVGLETIVAATDCEVILAEDRLEVPLRVSSSTQAR